MSQTFRSFAEIFRAARAETDGVVSVRASVREPLQEVHIASEALLIGQGVGAIEAPVAAKPESLAAAALPESAAATAKLTSAPNGEVSLWCSSLALVRLAAAEAYERAADRLLRALARDVLVRELALEPVDIEALVHTSLEAFSSDSPVSVALSPADAERVICDVPIRSDPTLAPGDLVLVVRDGTIDVCLGLRLEGAVDEAVR